MFERSLEARIVQWQQRTALQLAHEIRHPNTPDANRQEKIKQIEARAGVKSRHHHPVDIDKIHHDQRAAENRKHLDAPLDGPQEQEIEGNGKGKKNHHQCDAGPAARGAGEVPGNLLVEVSRPDDQKLRKRQVSPEHDEGQHEIAEIVEAVGSDDLGHGFAAGKQSHHEDDQSERGEHLQDHEDHAVDGGEPMRLERHEPIDGKERHREAVKDQSWPAHGFETNGETRVGGAVLRVRPVGQSAGYAQPYQEIDDIADQKKRQVQIRLLEFQDSVGGNEIGMHPGVQAAEAEKKRKDQDDEQRHGARACFERAADGQSPEASREVVHHQEGGAAQGETKPEDVGQQVGAKELLGGADAIEDGQNEQRGPQDKRALLYEIEAGGERS